MGFSELLSFIGVGLTFIVCIGGIVARDRHLSLTIVSGDRAVREELDKKIYGCTERINKTRDEFVRRDDLDAHMTRLEHSIADIHAAQTETNRRIYEFMAAMAAGSGIKVG